MSTQSLVLFLGVTLTMLLVPGPSALFAFTRSLELGPRAGLCAVAGLETGLCVHVLGATVGISGAVASSPVALSVLKLTGAGYLALLGLRELVHSRISATGQAAPSLPREYTRLFRDGMLVDLTNPKTLLFCLAFLPQFLDPGRGPVALQALLLGLAVVLLATLVDGGYALAAGAARRHQRVPGVSRSLQRGSGTAFLGLALLTVLS